MSEHQMINNSRKDVEVKINSAKSLKINRLVTNCVDYNKYKVKCFNENINDKNLILSNSTCMNLKSEFKIHLSKIN